MPRGWTDDCSVALPTGRSVDDVVELVLACRRKQFSHRTTIAELMSFGLSNEDAEVAIDRAQGGLYVGVIHREGATVFDPASFVSASREAVSRSTPAVAVPGIATADL